MDQAMVNIHWCMSLLDGLVSAGVTQLVISPGSRSTPLVIAADLHPGLQCHVIVDERSAAFFAMGMARYRMLPAALVCTSGSAPANWYPAVVEASQSSIPLLLLTADRPWELQACGANQTIDQVKLFGDQVRAFHSLPPAESSSTSLAKLQSLGRQVVSESLWPDAGPVHINMPFREPLVPANCRIDVPDVEVSLPATPKTVLHNSQVALLSESISAKPGMILCGPGVHDEGFAAEVTHLASKLDCPILADPLAELRFGGHDKTRIISHYSLFLSGNKAIDEPEWIIRFGAMPVSKALQTYLSTSCCQQFVVEQRGRWPDPMNQATQVLHASPSVLCEQLNGLDLQPAQISWCAGWVGQEKQYAQLLNSSEHGQPAEARLIRQLLFSLPGDSLLFSGNSMVIRYLDSYSGKADKELKITGNRGASGIDGNISTFLGLVSAYGSQGKPVAVIGDLAFFHDMNGLAVAKGLDAVLIVINNNGGGIFEQLPQKQLSGFDKYWRTPLNLDYSHAARMYDLSYHKLTDMNQFSAALAQALSEEGVSLVEVITEI
jgi:2-succinyl-5-enolpyruvyl-6-hydroxy-3-cyclohexene-1-carboxylate synthase